jgi:hypothetical protein
MNVLRAAKLQHACVPAVPCAQEYDKVAALVASSGGEDLDLLIVEDTGEPVVATGMEPVVKDIDRASEDYQGTRAPGLRSVKAWAGAPFN